VRQLAGVAAAQLQRHRVFLGVEVEVAGDVAVHQRAGRHHLGVQQRVAGEQAMEVAAMAVGPVHHRGDGQAPGTVASRKLLIHIEIDA